MSLRHPRRQSDCHCNWVAATYSYVMTIQGVLRMRPCGKHGLAANQHGLSELQGTGRSLVWLHIELEGLVRRIEREQEVKQKQRPAWHLVSNLKDACRLFSGSREHHVPCICVSWVKGTCVMGLKSSERSVHAPARVLHGSEARMRAGCSSERPAPACTFMMQVGPLERGSINWSLPHKFLSHLNGITRLDCPGRHFPCF